MELSELSRGQKVRICRWEDMAKELGIEYEDGIILKELCGQVVTITGFFSNMFPSTFVKVKEYPELYFLPEMFECIEENEANASDNSPVKDSKGKPAVIDEEIIIRKDENGLTGVLKVAGKAVKEKSLPLKAGQPFVAEDFERDAMSLVQELLKKELYNGKVVCIRNPANDYYTVGKIYEFKDGAILTNNGTVINNNGEGFHSFEEFAAFSSATFVKLVED